MKKVMYVVLLFLFITACSNTEEKENIYSESDSTQLEQVLKKQESINGFKSVMDKNDLLVALDIKRMKRFQMEKITTKITKELEEKFPNKEVMVTGDLKIKWEIEKVIDQQLKEDKLVEAIEKIKSLSKEET
ncbi:hypothetical protein MHH81_04765 [Psychrobacillus sp. FSL H8-0484]|uniref:hypothetical protein n=1 Tax=Psychrobacillus sp. FSL H8-0484 TaxID=2921390 RepID=UPI0030F9763F